MGHYYEISTEQMGTLLRSMEFQLIEKPGCHEDVYAYDIKAKPGLQILVYSSINSRGVARKVGADAIRVVIFSTQYHKPVGSEARVYRTTGWAENLKKRLAETMAQIRTLKVCQCGSWMVEREGRYGSFLGCVRYPDCKNTVKLQARVS